MVRRPMWLERIRRGWAERPVVWLSGVRRVGKTTLARMVPGAVYLNCDLPSTARRLDDAELFLGGLTPGSVLIVDEVHRLPDPSLLLKIAADEYSSLKILATGSSTLAATGKFRDSRAGRKVAVHLCPVLWEECAEPFGRADFDHRLLHGGLPEPLLGDTKSAGSYTEWIDIFYWRDKSGREVDIVVRCEDGRLDAFECKINPDEVTRTAVEALRRRYPLGDNFVVVPAVGEPYRIRRGE